MYKYNIAPCKDCQKREMGCHDRCEDYQQYKKDHALYNTYLQDAKQKERDASYIGFIPRKRGK